MNVAAPIDARTGEASPFAGRPRKLQPPDARLCPLCKGMRWLYADRDAEAGTPEFSALVACPACRGEGR